MARAGSDGTRPPPQDWTEPERAPLAGRRRACVALQFGSVLAPCLLLAAAGPAEPGASAPARNPAMRRVAATQVELGSTYAELIDTADWCNRLSHSAACRAEDFALELSLGRIESVASFWIDIFETTISEYERCVRAGHCEPHQMNQVAPGLTQDPSLPVTMVSQRDAATYCAFRGARLPKEEEFEVAARGGARRRFPWGDLFHAGRLNGGGPPPALTNADDGYELLAPTQAFSDGQTPAGVFQLAGNAAEWTGSRLRGPDGKPGQKFLVRGGHFASAPWQLRAAHREALLPLARRLTVGFRCARSAD